MMMIGMICSGFLRWCIVLEYRIFVYGYRGALELVVSARGERHQVCELIAAQRNARIRGIVLYETDPMLNIYTQTPGQELRG